MPNATTRGDLAEALIPAAAALVGAVHDGGKVEVQRVLDVIAPENLPAFAVVLAALVDPEKSIADLLEWVTFDEHEQAAEGMDHPHQVADTYGVKMPHGDPHNWDAATLRAGHAAAAHTRYQGVDWVFAGEREYQRRRMATKRGTENANPG
jgi:hypothetical protein